MFFIGLVEDARIEYKAAERIPRAEKTLAEHYAVPSEEEVEHPTMPILDALCSDAAGQICHLG